MKQDITVRDFMCRKDEVVRAQRDLIARNLERHRVTLVPGAASFDDLHYPTLGETYKYAAYDGLGQLAREGPVGE